MRHPEFNVNDFVESINGTARSVQGILDIYYPGMEEEDILPEELDEIDQLTVECNCCGWWVDAEDIDDMGNCTDCQDE